MKRTPQTVKPEVLEIVKRAREGAQEQLLHIKEMFESSGMKSAIETAHRVAGEVAARNREITEMIRQPLLDAPYIPAPIHRDVDEDRIARKVTRGVIDHFDRQRIIPNQDVITLRIRGNEIARMLPDGERRHRLTAKSRALLIALSAEYRLTKTLVTLSGYKNQETVHQTLGELKKKLYSKFELEATPIEGDEGLGYRLTENIRIIVDR